MKRLQGFYSRNLLTCRLVAKSRNACANFLSRLYSRAAQCDGGIAIMDGQRPANRNQLKRASCNEGGVINGKFYDAGAYKADPVPMALQSGTVYESLKSGVSQGLFTVSGALPETTGWVGDGKWRSTAEIKADAERNKAEAAKKAYKAPDDISGPPKLRRPQSDKTSSTGSQTTAPESSPLLEAQTH